MGGVTSHFQFFIALVFLATVTCPSACDGDKLGEGAAHLQSTGSDTNDNAKNDEKSSEYEDERKKTEALIDLLTKKISKLGDKRRLEEKWLPKDNGWDDFLPVAESCNLISLENSSVIFLTAGMPATNEGLPFDTNLLTESDRATLREALDATLVCEQEVQALYEYRWYIPPFDAKNDFRWLRSVTNLFSVLANRAHALHALGRHDESVDSAKLCFQVATKVHGGPLLAGVLVSKIIRNHALQSLLRVAKNAADQKALTAVSSAVAVSKNQVEMTSRQIWVGEIAYVMDDVRKHLDESDEDLHKHAADILKDQIYDGQKVEEWFRRTDEVLKYWQTVLDAVEDKVLSLANATSAKRFWDAVEGKLEVDQPRMDAQAVLEKLAAYEVQSKLESIALQARQTDMIADSNEAADAKLKLLEDDYPGYEIELNGNSITLRLSPRHPTAINAPLSSVYEIEVERIKRGK